MRKRLIRRCVGLSLLLAIANGPGCGGSGYGLSSGTLWPKIECMTVTPDAIGLSANSAHWALLCLEVWSWDPQFLIAIDTSDNNKIWVRSPGGIIGPPLIDDETAKFTRHKDDGVPIGEAGEDKTLFLFRVEGRSLGSWTINARVDSSSSSRRRTKKSCSGIVGIRVDSPNGGEKWGVGTSHDITWSSTGLTNVRLELSRNDGADWEDIVASTDGAALSYPWIVTGAASPACRVRVTDLASGATGVSDGLFTIAEVTVTAPDGGERWHVGETCDITWTSAEVTEVAVEVQRGWSSTATVKTYDPGEDVTTVEFTDPTLRLHAETGRTCLFDGGGEYPVVENDNTSITVQGDASAEGDSFGVRGPWESVVDPFPAAAGAYSWDVRWPGASECFARVRSLGVDAAVDASNGPFEIVGRTLLAWGINNGRLGDGTIDPDRLVPVCVLGGETGLNWLTDVKHSSGAPYYHSLAVREDGTVWSWGDNNDGELGNEDPPNVSYVPVQVHGGETLTPHLEEAVAVAAGRRFSVALRQDGTVYAWGLNDAFQVGRTGVGPYDAPVQVAGLTEISAIAAGEDFAVALKADGTVWAWGSNGSGQLGDDLTIWPQAATPVQVHGGETLQPFLTGVTAIACGWRHVLAVRQDGSVVAWGFNNYGQLGCGDRMARPAPVYVQGLSEGAAVGAGSYYSLALKFEGTVYSWGWNNLGQLGTGLLAPEWETTPVQVVGGETWDLNLQGVWSISSGAAHGYAIREDDSVWAWGSNGGGQLGENQTHGGLSTEPVQVYGGASETMFLNGIVQIFGAGACGFAIKE